MRKVLIDPKAGIRFSTIILLIGLGLIVLAIFVGSYSNGSVRCGDEIMQPGDTCVHSTIYGAGDTTSSSGYSYTEQKSANAAGQFVWGVVIALWGIPFCALGMFGLTNWIRKLRSAPKT